MRLEPLYQQERERTKLEGQQDLIIHQLNLKVGKIDASLIAKIRGLSIEQLQELAGALFNFSEISDLEAWFNN